MVWFFNDDEQVSLTLDEAGWYWEAALQELSRSTDSTWATPEAALRDLNTRLQVAGFPTLLALV